MGCILDEKFYLNLIQEISSFGVILIILINKNFD